MSRAQAVAEARRRWGRNGGVWESGPIKMVGRMTTIAGKRRLGWIAGEGTTWEVAFSQASFLAEALSQDKP